MEHLVIYDTTGKIYYMASGDVIAPQGLPHLVVSVPDRKQLVSVDTAVTPHAPVFADLPPSPEAVLKGQILVLQREIETLNDTMLELMGL